MIRVLQIVDNIVQGSGVSSVVMNLYKNVDRSKIQFDFLVCCKKDFSYEKQIGEMGGRVFYMGNPLSIKTFFMSLSNMKNFFRNATCYDIVHLHSPTIALFTLRYAKKYGIKNRIVHSHSTMMSQSRIKTLINNFLISRIKKYSNVFWACSTEAAAFLYGKEWLSTHEYRVINNAVDCNFFNYDEVKRTFIRKELDCSDKKVFCHVSNFDPIKNILFLVETIRIAVKSEGNILVLLVGGGPTYDAVVKKVKEYNLEKYFHFVGKSNKVNDYLCASDCLLLPSLKEGLPVTVVEAQSCGLPCLISDTITKEVNVCNVQYIPLKENSWAKAINDFLPLEKGSRLLNSQMFAKSKFSIKEEAKRVESLYMDMI